MRAFRDVLDDALVLVLTAVLSHVLYRFLMVPNLADRQAVPLGWWIGVASPLLACGLILGALNRSWQHIIASSAIAALAIQTLRAWAAYAGEPGYAKSLAIESPVEHWLLHSLLLAGVVFFLFAAGKLGRGLTSRGSLRPPDPPATPG